MSEMPQLDLFAAPPRPAPLPSAPPAPSLASALPRQPPATWNRLLFAGGNPPLEILVSSGWTGVVREVLSAPDKRLFLFGDERISEDLPRDGRCYRAVFLTPSEARQVHSRVKLALAGTPGNRSVRLVAAEPPAIAWSDLPAWLDGIEATDG